MRLLVLYLSIMIAARHTIPWGEFTTRGVNNRMAVSLGLMITGMDSFGNVLVSFHIILMC